MGEGASASTESATRRVRLNRTGVRADPAEELGAIRHVFANASDLALDTLAVLALVSRHFLGALLGSTLVVAARDRRCCCRSFPRGARHGGGLRRILDTRGRDVHVAPLVSSHGAALVRLVVVEDQLHLGNRGLEEILKRQTKRRRGREGTVSSCAVSRCGHMPLQRGSRRAAHAPG